MTAAMIRSRTRQAFGSASGRASARAPKPSAVNQMMLPTMAPVA